MKLLLKELYFSRVATAHTSDGNFSSSSKISTSVQKFSESGESLNDQSIIKQIKNTITSPIFKRKSVLAKILSVVFIIAALNSNATTYYVATNGNDANPGTINAPFKNWEKLEEVLAPGDIAYIRGGTYTSPRPFNDEYKVWWQYINGTAQNPITIQNYPGEFPVLDYSGQLFSTPGVYGLYLQYSSYVLVKGLRVTGLAQNPNGNAVNVFTLDNCNNVTVEGCEFDNSGGTGVVLLHSYNNLILNCDSHHLGDGFSPGYNWGGTNGFAITWAGNTSTNNTFRGCRAWEVSDNGFAFFGSSGVVTMENCWAFRIGWQPGTKLTGGDGVGYKLGPGNGQTTSVIRILRNCLAFENRFIGFDENFNGDNMYVAQIDNCAAYKNGIGNVTSNGYPYIVGYNYDFHQTTRTNIFRNNIGYVSANNIAINAQSNQVTNSWQSGVTVSDADFLSLSSVGMDGPRQADGSLPDLGFLKLAASSDLINAGTNIGLPFNGSAPDRSAFEFGSSQATNQAPTANAGANQNITLPTNSVTLTGTGTDPDGSITAYQWTKITGPACTIVSPTQASTVINSMVQGVYQFELRVTDNAGAFGKDTVTVTVNPAANQAPTANAGADQNITLPANSVTLTGTGTDPDGSITAYQWTKINGPACTIVSPTQASTVINSMVQGVYQFELRVTDNGGAFGKDTVTVTVNPAANQVPTANAGANQNITLPANSVTLTGTGTDPDGSITAYQWTKINGPACTIVSPTQASTVINTMVQGVYQFELRVTDNAGAFGKDTVTVTVNPAANQAPSANAGANQNITLPTNSVTLTGTGSDPDGSITAYQWTKITGPACTIVSPTQASTVINAMVQGVYQFELIVTDNAGAIDRDTVIVTVNAAPVNQPPSANAGANQNITLPTNSVTLTGTGSDPDGSITAYQWTKITGPACTIVSPTQASTVINSMVQGVYQFELRVTDNAGAIGRDTVIVTVNAAPVNQAPTANAGLNQNITLPTNSVTLTGTGSDPDGSITAYQWTKITGPACTIASPAQASTVINSMVQGVYQFELRVTDNAGAYGRDTVIVTVNAAANQAPTANAGLNQNITLPTNNVTLTGTGSDPDGSITAYQWTKINGPACTIVSPAQASTFINSMVQGVYQFELRVTDNAGAYGRDTVIVTVNAAANQAPTANAGANQTITLPANTVTLTGIGSDPDGSIVSYRWTKISGPAQYNLISSFNPQTTLNNLVAGTYQFQLEVTDNAGVTATDITTITVNQAPTPSNRRPTSKAGNNKKVSSLAKSMVLEGSGNDPDGHITDYSWRVITSPSQCRILNPSSPTTEVVDLTEGLYEFELKVTDNHGEAAMDTVEIEVEKMLVPSASIFPNPVTDVVNLKIETASVSGPASVVIYDMSGKLFYQEAFTTTQSAMLKKINVAGYRSGSYIVKITSDNKSISLKMVKQ